MNMLFTKVWRHSLSIYQTKVHERKAALNLSDDRKEKKITNERIISLV